MCAEWTQWMMVWGHGDVGCGWEKGIHNLLSNGR